MHKEKETFQNNWKCISKGVFFLLFLTIVRVLCSCYNKTGQGSFSDPEGNMHHTACVHMAKISPLHPPTQRGFIPPACWEESLAHASSQAMPGQGLVSRGQKPGQKAQDQLNSLDDGGQCLSPPHTSDQCSLTVWMQPARAVGDADKKSCVCIFNINRVWSEAS